jgi:hypothetical protein
MAWPTKPQVDDGESLRLEKDKIIKVVLLEDEPELYYTHYDGVKTNKCDAQNCQYCVAGMKRDTKGSIKVKDLADGKEKKLKGTAALFISLHETLDMCGGRKDFVFAMKATGEKQQRRYTITPLPKSSASVGSAPTHETEEVVPF